MSPSDYHLICGNLKSPANGREVMDIHVESLIPAAGPDILLTELSQVKEHRRVHLEYLFDQPHERLYQCACFVMTLFIVMLMHARRILE